jgi:hypothetical protein
VLYCNLALRSPATTCIPALLKFNDKDACWPFHPSTYVSGRNHWLSAVTAPSRLLARPQKRHGTRLYPGEQRADDGKGNVKPGIVVDRDICRKAEFEFYLNSHAGAWGSFDADTTVSRFLMCCCRYKWCIAWL